MGRTYSMSEKIMASELAYLDFDGKEGRKLGDIVNSIQEKYGNTDPSKLSAQEKSQLKFAESITKKAKENGVKDWENWSVEAVCNDNDSNGSGYYGMLIKTGEGEAIIASRGTENEKGKALNDWGGNNIQFLNGDGTSQEEAAQRFMEEIHYKYGDQYDSYTVTGHSLGGHLALHMAITAPRAMQEKINNATSIDGPGFSNKYINNHREAIDRMADKMNHYKYSIVGGLMNPLPGVNPEVIDAEGEFIDRHSMSNIKLDENGEPISGEEVFESHFAGEFTRYTDGYMNFKNDYPFVVNPFTAVPGIGMPFILVEKIILLRNLIDVYNELKNTFTEIDNWIRDVKYKYFKPKVSGNYEMDYVRINSIAGDINRSLSEAHAEAKDALDTINSMRSTWTSCAFIRSKIRSNIRSIENDIDKLRKLEDIMERAKDRYCSTDNSVAALF